jgi:uncharacterized protein (DUF1330 family)
VRRSGGQIDALLDELAQHLRGELNPSIERLRALLEADRDGPLHFLNLLAYRDEALYPAGHEMASRNLSGAAAYALYAAVAIRHVTQRGGRLVALNDVQQELIGAGQGGWHQVAIVEYPDTEAFVDMIRDPDYEASLVHRDAGLARTLILVTRPLAAPASQPPARGR